MSLGAWIKDRLPSPARRKLKLAAEFAVISSDESDDSMVKRPTAPENEAGAPIGSSLTSISIVGVATLRLTL